MNVQVPSPVTHALFDADPGEQRGTLYIEGNRSLVSLNLSRVYLLLFI